MKLSSERSKYGQDYKILEKSISEARYNNLPAFIQVNDENSISKFEKFSLTVKAICGIVGLKNFPDSATLILLEQTFSEQYGNLTLSEFSYAFQLNLFNEYAERYHHYNSFDLTYMTAVMEAYKIRLRNAANILKYLPEEKKQIEAGVVTDPETVKKYSEKIQATISRLTHKESVKVPRINNHKFFDPIQNETDRKELLNKIIPGYTHEQLDDTLEHYQSKQNEYRANNKVEYLNIIKEIIVEIELEQELRRQNVLHVIK